MTTVPELAVRQVRTVAVDDPGPLLGLLPEAGALAWVRGGDGIVGWGEAARIELPGPAPFADAAAWWSAVVAAAEVDDDVRLPGSGLVAFGSFAFDRGTSVLVVPEVVVGRSGGTTWVTTAGDGRPVELTARPPVRAPRRLDVVDTTAPAFTDAVAEAVARIQAGQLAKVVLARDVEARLDAPVDVRWPLQQLARQYPACWTFSVDGLLGATPEMLVSLRGGEVSSRVLAGTLERSGDATKDQRRSLALGRSIKDLEEHGYGVRSVVEALGAHCVDVDVPSSPFVLDLANVMHLATDVTGTVADGASSLDLLASLHPSAAVCGAPTSTARGVIREIENLDRGRYAGPVGWLDARGDGEWGIALRCAQVDPDDPARLRLFAGCGIVDGSRPAGELAESGAKLLAMRSALAPPA
ncbi:MAG TPA: isochorismate synthase [Mycobacteriales bacterium]|nr:isochorismate synthase [Mycobacteriales bacterium]